MDFLLDPEVTFLNHGSYGACPAPVFARYQELQRELERNPVEFLARRFDELTAEARAALAAFVGARADDLVFVPNATAGLNAVIRSLQHLRGGLEPGDEVLTTRHEYGAVTRTWEFAGARLVYAEPEEVAGAIGPRTRAVSVSHITSPTALVLPVEEICAAAREAGVLSIVDGAHVPGQLPLDLAQVGADIYAGNCHKWLCAPKGAGFVWARPEHQGWIDPLVVSWGYDEGFVRRHGWQGTRDPAAALAVPAAIEAHRSLDLERCRRLAASFHDRLPPVGTSPAPQMWASEVDTADPDALQRRLFDEHRIEVVVREWEGRNLLRVSIGPYNEAADVERLLEALNA
ncbi:MAG TPA: aminotransferase class V-fold PLP-dependent enzyme [Gaiellaceae bacterium]|nr:aminotransferase class V-fold PLP-dependent enzyme [Gaiellaceae bacterium]